MSAHRGAYQALPPPAFAFGDDCGQHCGNMPRRLGAARHCPTCHAISHARRIDEQHNAAPPPVDARAPQAMAAEVDAIEQRDPRLVKRTEAVQRG